MDTALEKNELAIKAGQRLTSTVDTTSVIVVRGTAADVEVGCGGGAVVEDNGAPTERVGQPDPALQGGTVLGKRYADDVSGVELLCTKSGQGTLTIDGRTLVTKAAKTLPSSD